MDPLEYNRSAWNHQVSQGNRWTIPVSSEMIQHAREGSWEIVLTPIKPVPKEWFPDLNNLPTLCLASGGGQQGPILAAAGAKVTVFDNSDQQLAQDQQVADRDQLDIECVQGDMADLSVFADETFGLIFHPCSNVFSQTIRPVWKEAFRVLKPGGVMLSGFTNPIRYLFPDERFENGDLSVQHKIPYSDLESLSTDQLQQLVDNGEALEFSHTLEEQLGGQTDAGFHITGFYEDRYPDLTTDPLSCYIDSFIATRAWKPV